MNDLVFTVPAAEWTVEEFDRQVRGFKAKLVAFGDVFITAPVTEAKPEPAAQPVAKRDYRQDNLDKHWGFSAEVVRKVLELKPFETIFVEHSNPPLAQARALTALCQFRKEAGEAVYIRTSRVMKGERRGIQIRRVA
jgi:hypothetical protein